MSNKKKPEENTGAPQENVGAVEETAVKASAPEENTGAAAPAAEPPYDPWKDMVSIKIPRDRNTKEDVLVIVNGRPFVIMRGVDVEVPRPIFEALRDQEEALLARDAFIDANEIKATKD